MRSISAQSGNTVFARASRYLAKMPPAVSGSGGHNSTFKAACALVHGFALDQETAVRLLVEEYNPTCDPPWTEHELRHKVRSAEKPQSNRPRGYLLNDDRRPERPRPPRPERRPWPDLTTGSRGREWSELAERRGVSLEAIDLGVSVGLIRFGWNRGFRCWFTTDGDRLVAEARRLDGETFQIGDGKARTDTFIQHDGAGRHAVGLPLLGEYPVALLVEGSADLLAALDVLLFGDLLASVAALALLGASARFLPGEVSRLTSKRVLVLYDADETGQRQARKRAAELEHAGAEPFLGELPEGCEDLNDAVRNGQTADVVAQLEGILQS